MGWQHGHPWQLLLACSLCLASASASMDVIINRFGRSLLQSESERPSYLVPTQIPALCHGPSCCQEDDHTSAYQVMMLDSSQTQIAGRTYTTFFMKLVPSAICQPEIDTFGCCTANVKTIWIDVDPDLNVVASTLNGASINSIQDTYGFRFTLSPADYQALSSPDALVSVTVSGEVEQLCPIPDLAPVQGLCDVILEGDNATHAGACCPRGLSIQNPDTNWVPPANYFSCNADLAASPFALAQPAISNLYMAADGGMYVDYVLNLTRNAACAAGPNSCCGMRLTDLELRVMSAATIAGVTIDSLPRNFTQSPWLDNGPTDMSVLSVSGLSWGADDVAPNGKELVVTVSIPIGATQVPHLCDANTDPTSATYGACSYFLYQADNGLCCPSGQTEAATGPVLPASCNPTQAVALADTSMLFTYYEFFNGPQHADFVFQVANQKPCTKPNCVDICGWSLAVNDAVLDTASFQVQDTSNVVNTPLSARTLVQRGPNAAVQFSFTPGADQSFYRLRTPVGTQLSDLCRANAHPDQGSWPCVATLKSSTMYAVMFFDQSMLAIKEYPNYCPAAWDLSQSCVRPSQVRYNSPDGNSDTSMEFVLTRYDPATTGCRDVAGLSFSVMLQRGPTEELQDSARLQPSDGVAYVPSSGLTWSSASLPASNNAASSYFLQLDGTRDLSRVCIQGLPDQPPNSCMVQLQAGTACFNGFVVPTHDPSLTWGSGGSSGGDKAAKIVPAVVVPLVVVAVGVLAAVFFVRRRRRSFNAAQTVGGDPDLRAPLNLPTDAHDPSDVHISLRSGGRFGLR